MKKMGFYPEDIIKEVQNAADIVAVVSEYVSLKKQGENYKGLCPFHDEKTPSFSVNGEKQLFYCFGCGAGGNVFNFVMKKENLSFPEAVRYLADKFNVRLPHDMNQEFSEEFRTKREYFSINRLAAKYYNYCLLHTSEGKNAINYLKKRGIRDETIEKFCIGYAPKSWNSLIKFYKSKGISAEALEKIGLAIPRKDKKGFYDRFRNRIIFPIEDITRNIIGFGGRALDESLPKYLNSPETPLFSKGDNLYALSKIKKDPSLDVIIVEGYMDCIMLHQHGFENAVASLGTALTKNQAKLLKKYTNSVILSYDGDAAGEAATVRGMEVLAQEGLYVKVLALPEGKDPDEIVSIYGPDYFRGLLNNAEDLINYKLTLAKKGININNSEEKLKFIERAIEILSAVDSEPELEIYARKLASEIGISAGSIIKEAKGKRKKSAQAMSRAGSREGLTGSNNFVLSKAPAISGVHKAERKLLKFMLESDNRMWKNLGEKIEPRFFTNKNTKKIAEIIFEMVNKNQEVNASDIFNYLDEEEGAELSAILFENLISDDKEIINSLVVKIKQGYLKKAISQVRREIKEAEMLGQREEINSLLNTYQQLKTEMNGLKTYTNPGKEGA
ncbi:DNA primase [Tepidanaerobacter sp. EBM-49]|uniref:DNA primase n=1 Tax=Tepidanaerobacter sp. EBM-49 TaxID=1918504 RepID=UPI00257A3EBB|nr:DNA primase [Tepidanaerobacter sp. EBM-49]